jgi:hypothetical protein
MHLACEFLHVQGKTRSRALKGVVTTDAPLSYNSKAGNIAVDFMVSIRKCTEKYMWLE